MLRPTAGDSPAVAAAHPRQPISSMDLFSYDVPTDGQKFIINNRLGEPNVARLSIILNWVSEMEK